MLFHREAISTPSCSLQESRANAMLSPRNVLPSVGITRMCIGRLGTDRASCWSQKWEQWELITNPSETSAERILKMELEGREASIKNPLFDVLTRLLEPPPLLWVMESYPFFPKGTLILHEQPSSRLLRSGLYPKASKDILTFLSISEGDPVPLDICLL